MSERYVCTGCGKDKDYLSESWHTVRFGPDHVLYFCLECISDKKEWHGDAR